MADRPSERLARHHEAVLEFCSDFGASDVRVFGSVARGTDRPDSDVDLLITTGPDTSHFDLITLRIRLEDLLGCRVDLLTSGALTESAGDAAILAEAAPCNQI